MMSALKRLVALAIVGATLVGATALPAIANHPSGPPDKVVICHKPGTPAEKTLTLPHPAAEAHIRAHGDTPGPCNGYTP